MPCNASRHADHAHSSCNSSIISQIESRSTRPQRLGRDALWGQRAGIVAGRINSSPGQHTISTGGATIYAAVGREAISGCAGLTETMGRLVRSLSSRLP